MSPAELHIKTRKEKKKRRNKDNRHGSRINPNLAGGRGAHRRHSGRSQATGGQLFAGAPFAIVARAVPERIPPIPEIDVTTLGFTNN
jgi:hypothetical protein